MRLEDLEKEKREIIKGLLDNMVRIEGGVFKMGDGEEDRSPVHEVRIDEFEIMANPVTQSQYKVVMGENPSVFKGSDNPVENVNWYDAAEFGMKLSKLTGYKFRFPTEAEWEYACRAGTKTKYFFGDSDCDLGQYAWYIQNSNEETHPVGRKRPNPWRLYDMLGNVWEWCSDWYSNDYYNKTPKNNPKGPSNGSKKVLRGGSWFNYPSGVSVAYHGWAGSWDKGLYWGVRCVRES